MHIAVQHAHVYHIVLVCVVTAVRDGVSIRCVAREEPYDASERDAR